VDRNARCREPSFGRLGVTAMASSATSAMPPVIRRHLVVYTAALAAIATGLMAAVVNLPALDAVPFHPLLLVPMFAAAEVFVVHLRVQRSHVSFSVSEVPLVLGLAAVAPWVLVASRMIGAGTALVLHRRQPKLKLAFNLAAFQLEVCTAVLVYRWLLTTARPDEPRGWLAAFAATALIDVLSSALIAGAMAIVNGGNADAGEMPRTVGLGQLTTAINTTLALVAMLVLGRDVRAAGLLAVVIALVVAAYRGYAMQEQARSRLEAIQEFTRAVGGRFDVEAVLRLVLEHAQATLHAEQATIALSGNAPIAYVLDRSGQLSRAPLPDAEAWFAGAYDDRPVLLARGERTASGQLFPHRDGMAVPLRTDDGVVGVLALTDSLVDVGGFGRHEARVLESLANHAAVALRNSRLVDRLRDEVHAQEHQSLHDALTGLPNRRFFEQVLEEALHAPTAPDALAVVLLDVDGFKDINDTLGHAVGDQLLVAVADRLARRLPSGGLIARLGGDEFGVLLSHVVDVPDAISTAESVLAVLDRPFLVGDTQLVVRASAGITVSGVHGDEASLLMQRADIAMYAAKGELDGVCGYSLDLDRNGERRLHLASDLRSAVAGGQLSVVYQPKCDLQTGATVGVEALLRWQHPTLGEITPDEFIPLAEQSGLIRPITLFVLETALTAVAAWRAEGVDTTVAVNLSARHLLDAALPDDVSRLLLEKQVSPSVLTLELTESSIMADPQRSMRVLHGLRGLGVRLSIDDFGTGYSALAYLKRLPIDEVKIDKSFVVPLTRSGDDEAIVRTIIELAHHLRLRVVAEGVEDADTLVALHGLRCDVVQGFHLGRPADLLTTTALLLGKGRGPGLRAVAS
jgi:diguanylate cyclase (GGDEF)-like protein